MSKTNKLQVEYRPVESITESEHNSREHSPEQVRQIAGSIRRFGFSVPVLIDENKVLIAGAGRLQAILSDPELRSQYAFVPTITLRHLSDIEKRAYMLADNRIALNATWNYDALRIEAQEIARQLSLDSIVPLGFSEIESENYLSAFAVSPEVAASDELLDYDNKPHNYYQSIRVHFRTKEDVERFALAVKDLLGPQVIDESTMSLWLPAKISASDGRRSSNPPQEWVRGE